MDTKRTGKKTYQNATPNVILRRAFQKKYHLPKIKYIPDPKGIFVDKKGKTYNVYEDTEDSRQGKRRGSEEVSTSGASRGECCRLASL